jgi:hypothetical protein
MKGEQERDWVTWTRGWGGSEEGLSRAVMLTNYVRSEAGQFSSETTLVISLRISNQTLRSSPSRQYGLADPRLNLCSCGIISRYKILIYIVLINPFIILICPFLLFNLILGNHSLIPALCYELTRDPRTFGSDVALQPQAGVLMYVVIGHLRGCLGWRRTNRLVYRVTMRDSRRDEGSI